MSDPGAREIELAPDGPGGLSRRTFLNRAGLVSALAVLGQLPAFLGEKGWLAAAEAAESDMTRDTINGLVAFVIPGPDEYSVAQGESSPLPGGIAANTTTAVIDLFDGFVGLPVPGSPTLASSGAVATLLNETALQVNPGATGGGFASPFARLVFAEKIEVFRRLEEMTEGSEFRFVSGILIGAVALLGYSEAGVMDPATRQPTSKPVGWTLAKFGGPVEGRNDFRGYYQGRRKVGTDRRFRSRRSRR